MAFILLRSTVRKGKPSAMRMALIPGASFFCISGRSPLLFRVLFHAKDAGWTFPVFPGDRGVGHGLSRYFILP